jgi:hypothetical protein
MGRAVLAGSFFFLDHAQPAASLPRPARETEIEMTKTNAPSSAGISRRGLIKGAAATAALLASARKLLPSGAHAAAAAPEVTGAKLGFIALTDASPLIIPRRRDCSPNTACRTWRC